MKDIKLPNHPESYFRNSVSIPAFPTLKENMEADVVIVGGGITGITSAYLLANEGLKVVLLEADRILNGTTGHTTAKITAQHGLVYSKFISHYGLITARDYYKANEEALQFIKETINKQQIDCDLQDEDAIMYATDDQSTLDLEKEEEAYRQIGIKGRVIDKIPFKVKTTKALVMDNQAQFNPVKYLAHLAGQFIKKGGQIFEGTTAVNIEKGDRLTVATRENFSVSGKHILICTHFPFYEGLGLYSARMYADRSYIIAVKTKQSYPGGMYISAGNPTRSIRSVMIDGNERVLIGGESHRTGEGKDTMEHYRALESFAEKLFDIEDIPFRWSAQDLTTLDDIPYIGSLTQGDSHVLVATGFNKWGMTNGTAAALLFRDKVLEKEHPYEELYSPSRFHAHPSIIHFLEDNAKVVGHLAKGKLDLFHSLPDSLSPGSAALVTIKGQRKGVFKDDDGQLYLVDTTCTHIGCEVVWNNAERSWDCPCHGSRFSFTGEVLEGPAEKPLKHHDYTMLDTFLSDESGY